MNALQMITGTSEPAAPEVPTWLVDAVRQACQKHGLPAPRRVRVKRWHSVDPMPVLEFGPNRIFAVHDQPKTGGARILVGVTNDDEIASMGVSEAGLPALLDGLLALRDPERLSEFIRRRASSYSLAIDRHLTGRLGHQAQGTAEPGDLTLRELVAHLGKVVPGFRKDPEDSSGTCFTCDLFMKFYLRPDGTCAVKSQPRGRYSPPHAPLCLVSSDFRGFVQAMSYVVRLLSSLKDRRRSSYAPEQVTQDTVNRGTQVLRSWALNGNAEHTRFALEGITYSLENQ